MPSPGFPQLPARILGTGRYLPRHVVTDADIDRRLGWPAGRCFKKNRVARRHFADGDETSTRMAAAALTDALAAASLDAPALDAIIAVSVLPEQPMPTNAVLVHRALGASRPIVCFDINASCLGFLQALDVAAAMIAAGTCRTIGVVASEVASKGLNWQDADTCTLFGDGAAAVVVGRESSLGSGVIFGSFFETYPEGADHTQIAAGGTRWNVVTHPPSETSYFFAMNGPGVFKLASEKLPKFMCRFFERSGLGWQQIDCVVPHQASALGLRYLEREFRIPHRKIVNILEDHGNQVSVSMPHALHVAITTGRLERGQTALLVGTGAGLTCAAMALRY